VARNGPLGRTVRDRAARTRSCRRRPTRVNARSSGSGRPAAAYRAGTRAD